MGEVKSRGEESGPRGKEDLTPAAVWTQTSVCQPGASLLGPQGLEAAWLGEPPSRRRPWWTGVGPRPPRALQHPGSFLSSQSQAESFQKEILDPKIVGGKPYSVPAHHYPILAQLTLTSLSMLTVDASPP